MPRAELELTKAELPIVQNGNRLDTPESLMRLAIERNVDPSTMERIAALIDRAEAKRAKGEYDAAMASFQKACPVVKKNKPGPNNAYKYAPLEDVVSAVKDLIFQHGFSYSIDSDTPSDGWVTVTCKVTHRAGHSETSAFKIPVDVRNRMMSDPQRYLGSLTFAKRVAFCNAFGIVCAGEDKDGVGKAPQAPGPAVATEKTRKWMIESLKDVEQEALAYFIEAALIMPNETLDHVPLSEVPTTKQGLAALRNKILRQQ